MNTFFYFEGRIFKTEEAVKKATQNYNCKRFDIIETNKSFEEFEDEFIKAREEGNSDLDSIEWAR